MGDEHPGDLLLVVERAHGPEGLRRRRGVELDQLGSAVRAYERVRKVVRVDELRREQVGAEFALRREHQVRERGAIGASTASRDRERKPPTRVSSSNVAESSTAYVWVRTSRVRTCASSWRGPPRVHPA